MRSRKVKSAPVGVIGKVLAVLELLDQAPGGLQLREIAERTGIPSYMKVIPTGLRGYFPGGSKLPSSRVISELTRG